jgi:hypothetical protein
VGGGSGNLGVKWKGDFGMRSVELGGGGGTKHAIEKTPGSGETTAFAASQLDSGMAGEVGDWSCDELAVTADGGK